MRDRETWQDACGALGGDLDKAKTHCSLRWEILEKLGKIAGSALGGPRQRKEKKRHTAL
jgi:hypothetical protein